MRSKKISGSGDGHGEVEWFLMVLHVAACSFENSKRCMALVKMTHVRLKTQGTQQAPASNTQHDFLLQPHLSIAAIELAGDPAMSCAIGEVVGVQEVEFAASHTSFPAAQPDFRSR